MLAKDGCSSPNVVDNSYYSKDEIYLELRNGIRRDLVSELTSRTDGKTRLNQTHRDRLGPLPWHTKTSMENFRKLHRLRSGYNKMGAVMSRIDELFDPFCSACLAVKSVQHVLIDCPLFNLERNDLNTIMENISQPLNLLNILGLNVDIAPPMQIAFQRRLLKFIRKTQIINQL